MPRDDVFVYTKAHSKVQFDRMKGTFHCDQKEFTTPSIYVILSECTTMTSHKLCLL